MRQALVVRHTQNNYCAKSRPVVESPASEISVEERDVALFPTLFANSGQVQRSRFSGIRPRSSSTHKDACRVATRSNPEVNLFLQRCQRDFDAVFPISQLQWREPLEITNLKWFFSTVSTFLVDHIQESHPRKPSFSRDPMIRA